MEAKLKAEIAKEEVILGLFQKLYNEFIGSLHQKEKEFEKDVRTDKFLILENLFTAFRNAVRLKDTQLYEKKFDTFYNEFVEKQCWEPYSENTVIDLQESIKSIKIIAKIIRDNANIFFNGSKLNSDGKEEYILKSGKCDKKLDSCEILDNEVAKKIAETPISLPIVSATPISGIYILLMLYQGEISFQDWFWSLDNEILSQADVSDKKRKTKYRNVAIVLNNIKRYFHISIVKEKGAKWSDDVVELCGIYRFCNGYGTNKVFTFLDYPYLLIHDGIHLELTEQQNNFLIFQTILLYKLQNSEWNEIYKFDVCVYFYHLILSRYVLYSTQKNHIIRKLAEDATMIPFLSMNERNDKIMNKYLKQWAKEIWKKEAEYWEARTIVVNTTPKKEIIEYKDREDKESLYFLILWKSHAMLITEVLKLRYKYWDSLYTYCNQDTWKKGYDLLAKLLLESPEFSWSKISDECKTLICNLFYDKSEKEIENAFIYSMRVLKSLSSLQEKKSGKIYWNSLIFMMFIMLRVGNEQVRDFNQNKNDLFVKTLRNIRNHYRYDLEAQISYLDGRITEIFAKDIKNLSCEIALTRKVAEIEIPRAKTPKEVLDSFHTLFLILENSPIFKEGMPTV